MKILVWVVVGLLMAWYVSGSQVYEASDECRLTPSEELNSVALLCHLRTINSEIDATNFSAIPSYNTVSLKIQCSDVLFFQSALPNKSFVLLTDLINLDIQYCKIGEVPKEAFLGLHQLRNLTFRTYNSDWSAMSLKLDPEAFADQRRLEILDLGDNNIWTLPPRLFCELGNLTLLNLSRNKLQEIIDLSFNQFNGRCAQSLRHLDVSHNHFGYIPAFSFSALKTLSTLNLSLNGVQELADQALFGMYSLQVLDLSNNLLTTLPPEMFKENKRVTKFYARNNSLSVLAPGLFAGMDLLLELDLSQNDLTNTWVNSETFSNLIRLALLNLSHNKITRLDAATFRDLTNMQILNLQYNEIETIADKTFDGLLRLHTLLLSHNKIKEIGSGTFFGLTALAELRLDNNEIFSIDKSSLLNASKLKDLSLNNNYLQEVPIMIKIFNNLISLDISRNMIDNILPLYFERLSQLTMLNVAQNSLQEITKETFYFLKSLQILNLSRNKIQSIENGAFKTNVNLKAVRIDGNSLTNIYGLFSNLTKLKWLNASENRIQFFDYAFIPETLEYLDLRSNAINELANYFEIENKLNLRILDVSYNHLRALGASSVPDSIEILFLNNNAIATIQPYTFFKKKNLTRVDLYANRLKYIDQNALRLSDLEPKAKEPEFYLGENPFECDCKMEWLQLVNNQEEVPQTPRVVDLASINCHLLNRRQHTLVPLLEVKKLEFLCRYESHCFSLCHCCEFDACDCEMTCPSNCVCSHDESWSANIVDCAQGGHKSIPERIPMDASEVYLDGNSITSLSSHTFIGRRNLRVLYLNNSKVDFIFNRTFNGLKQLKILYLSNNYIKELKGFEFENLSKLEELLLHNNQLQTIHNATFTTLTSLKILRLDGNKLHVFDFEKFNLNKNLVYLNLANNPWSCECGHLESISSLVLEATFVEKKNLFCYFNDTTHISVTSNISFCGNSVGMKSFNQAVVYQDYIFLPTITLGCAAILLLLLIIVFCNRNRIRVWLYAKYGLRLFHKSEYDGDKNKLFDAFLSYSSKDEVFVTQILAPELERGSPSYKLCLQYRDFPVGTYISDTILSAVETSRRTVLVLSENFIKTEWCRFEFRSAHHEVLRDRRRRLIVILLGDVPQRDLDPDIRLYLKTNTYLKWGDKRFWEKLKFAMPDVQPPSRVHHLRSLGRGTQPT